MSEDRIAQLEDALNGCVDWIKENCPGPGYPYCVTEAEAALKDIHVINQKES